MFSIKHTGKIKNDKTIQWGFKLSICDFNIVLQMCFVDAQCQLNCIIINLKKLEDLHNCLCHPGVKRLAHFFGQHNLPFLVNQVQQVAFIHCVCRNHTPIF